MHYNTRIFDSTGNFDIAGNFDITGNFDRKDLRIRHFTEMKCVCV
jgi:hypothetical protein